MNLDFPLRFGVKLCELAKQIDQIPYYIQSLFNQNSEPMTFKYSLHISQK